MLEAGMLHLHPVLSEDTYPSCFRSVPKVAPPAPSPHMLWATACPKDSLSLQVASK
jgi:hypothetical protein